MLCDNKCELKKLVRKHIKSINKKKYLKSNLANGNLVNLFGTTFLTILNIILNNFI